MTDEENFTTETKEYDEKVKFLMDLPSASMSSRCEDSQSECEIFDDNFKPEEFYFSCDGLSQNGTIVNISDKEDLEESTINRRSIDKELTLEKSINAFKDALDAQIEIGSSSEESSLVCDDNVNSLVIDAQPELTNLELPEKPGTASGSSARPPTIPNTPRLDA